MKRRIAPGPGQESVWDYPRPPKVEDSAKRIRIIFNGEVIADTRRAKRVLETSHPPVYYLPKEAVKLQLFEQETRTTFCEFKGQAHYFLLRLGDKEVASAAWRYPNPAPGFEAIKDCLAFYPSKMDACFVEDEQVKAQAGDFYGGWITSDIVGPFKGGPGTWGW